MRARTLYIYIACLFCWGIHAQTEEVYRTKVFREDIRSLEIKVLGEIISTPFIELNGEKQIEISFDAMYRTSGRFAYSVIHCDADWKKSGLLPIEYMKGFQQTAIEDFANAFGTTTHFTNYKLLFPNEDTQLTVSGNYAVLVYEEDTPNKVVFMACFSVVEPMIEIEAGVTGNTDIDFNREHQQVEFTLNTQNMNIAFPQNDLKLFVYQNNNLNDVRTNLSPSMISNNQLQYKHVRDLIFEAGNEYRRIEFLTHRYNGMGVESIKYFDPYYHVTLQPEKKREHKPYLYDHDQNGRFFVRCTGCDDPDTEGDYYVVHFALASEQMTNGKMYLYGDFFNNNLDSRSLVEYDKETGSYAKGVLLKTGLYNYQYIFLEDNATTPSFKRTEGNFFETENEYTITVYYRPIGTRYDRLIGQKTFSSQHGLMSPR